MRIFFQRKSSRVLSVWPGILLMSCMCAQPAPAFAQADTSSSSSRLVEALKSYIPHVLHLCNTPGLNLALARRGKVIWEEGLGYADLERQIPMTAQTVMHSGSMGKTYTATAIMQL